MLHGTIVSHKGERCGVYQFGRRLFEALTLGPGVTWTYLECSDPADLRSGLDRHTDIVLFNHVESTMPWLIQTVPEIEGPILFSVQHEGHFCAVDVARPEPFHFLLCPDPTLFSPDPRIIGLPRFSPSPIESLPPEPDIFTVSSFGFATHGKGFERLCRLVNEQFDEARIRINIPDHDTAELSKCRSKIVAACQAEITKPDVTLDLTGIFFDDVGLINFLAESTINAFAYEREGEGVSSCIDYALAARRPIAVNGSAMFRNVHGINPSVRLDLRPLAEIASHGFAPLVKLQEQSSAKNAGEKWNMAIVRACNQVVASRKVPDGRGFNKILDDRSRAAYSPEITELARLSPEVIAKKFPRANVQQAFAFDAVKRLAGSYLGPRILAIGSYEDTAVSALRAEGYSVEEIDPNVNGLDLASFYALPTTRLSSYDLIMCVSVLEHVDDDELFVALVANLLAPNGTAIFTVDFSENFLMTGKRPGGDYRLFTSADLAKRLMDSAHDCVLVDAPKWDDGQDDFEYDGCTYSFGTWVFRKHSPEEMTRVRRRRTVWPTRLEVGIEQPRGVRKKGLYPLERYQDRPLLWTSEHAEIIVPLTAATPPKTLSARFWGISPPNGTEYHLFVNGAELARGRINGEPIEHILPLPGLTRTTTIRILLKCSGFRPQGDARVLGLAMESIALLQ